jgi:NitT/TauT family transport system permease protein
MSSSTIADPVARKWPFSFEISGPLLRFGRFLLFLLALLALWQLVVEVEVWPSYVFPSPGDVFESLRRNFENGRLQEGIQITMKRLAIGFSISFVIGMTVGIACGTIRYVDDTVGGLVLGMQSLPSIVWLPLALVWFGLNEQAVIFVVLMGSVWAIAISARDGVRNIPPLLSRAGRTFGAGRYQMVRYVYLPGMLPMMIQGLKLGWSFAWRSLMAAELILQGSLGLGGLLTIARNLNNISMLMAIMLVIIAIGLIVDRLIFGPLEGWVRSRWGLSQA